jgi:transposase-like protein
MPWKMSQLVSERMKFILRLEQGETMSVLCREFGISRKTGYKFLERYKRHGVEGLTNQSRSPITALPQIRGHERFLLTLFCLETMDNERKRPCLMIKLSLVCPDLKL